MKLKIDKDALLKGLARVHPVADKKAAMPILAHILVRAEGETVRLLASDLYSWVTTVATAEIEEGGELAIHADTFWKVARNMPGDSITIESLPDNVAVHIKSKRSKYKVPVMQGADFPKMPEVKPELSIKLPASDLGRVVAASSHAISADETRPHLAGLYLTVVDGGLRAVATDGHRLAMSRFDHASLRHMDLLLPRKGAALLSKFLATDKPNEVELSYDKSWVFFSAGDTLMAVKRVDDAFPPYEKVIPSDHPVSVEIDRSVLSEALRRVLTIASLKLVRLTLTVNDEITLRADDADIGSGQEVIEAPVKGTSEGLEIAFNGAYMLEQLGAFEGPVVVIQLNGKLDPIVVRDSSTREDLGVLMPMRY